MQLSPLATTSIGSLLPRANFRKIPKLFLVMQAASPGNKQFRILLIAKAIAIINRNHVLFRLPPPLRRMRFSEATR